MVKEKVDIAKEFRKILKSQNTDIGSMYHHLFSILKDDRLNELLEHYKSIYKKDESWFYEFHKSIRQTDFFDGLNCYYLVDKLDPKQRRRRNFILKKRQKEYQQFKKETPNEDYEKYKIFDDNLRGWKQ